MLTLNDVGCICTCILYDWFVCIHVSICVCGRESLCLCLCLFLCLLLCLCVCLRESSHVSAHARVCIRVNKCNCAYVFVLRV